MLAPARSADHAGDVARILRERAARLAMPTATRTPGGAAHLIAGVANHRVAVPMSSLVQVVPAPRVTRLPGSAPALVGIVAVGGELVPVADLAQLLHLDAEGPRSEGLLLTIDDGDSRLGLRVDRVDGQTTIRTQDIASMVLASAGAALLAAPVADDDLLVLNVAAALSDPRLGAARSEDSGEEVTE